MLPIDPPPELIKDVRVAVGYPSGELVSTQFMLHMVSMLMRNKIPLATFVNGSSSRIAFNRNAVVEMAQQAQATHLLFVDSDMTFPSDGLQRLFMHQRDIIGATASKRIEGKDDAIGVTLDESRLQIPSPPVKMKLLGPCFMLIRMEVFDKIRKPWFAEPPNWMIEEPGNDGLMPEDEYFCYQAIKAGYDVWCDIELSMEIGHRGPKTYYIMRPTKE
jgi:hypothetical protein